MKSFLLTYLLACLLAATACNLSIGRPSQLPDAPAPTAIPLDTTAEPASGQNIRPPERGIALPPGFGITVFADNLDGPRMLAVGPDGQLYVAERGAGRIVRLPDADGDGLADGVQVVAEGLDDPSSLAFYTDGSLYVAETRRVLRLSQPDPQGVFQNKEVVVDGLPSGGHNTRTVVFSPDYAYLYVSVGSSCNVCDEEDERRAAVMRYNPDGSGAEIFARGLRNAVGLAFRPDSGQLWATNNGRDLLGDDLPPETVYQVQAGADYGWPRCHSGRIVDPDFGEDGDCDGVPGPQVEMQAHAAPLGLTFYTGSQFPTTYQGDLFVAFHGSWNRSTPTGYKIVRIPLENDTPGPVMDFASGWLAEDGERWGRPVDLAVGPDGSLFVSDDGQGRIYRIFFTGE